MKLSDCIVQGMLTSIMSDPGEPEEEALWLFQTLKRMSNFIVKDLFIVLEALKERSRGERV